ncbi:hypothetical protein [Isoalcanivorax beigongshangi]|uniref:PilZ domain-containing protein n=1 Tax=Isoalcanivorax beigongshangi TaxID=3238810 RepID=A0ABV4AE49_9GAMM
MANFVYRRQAVKRHIARSAALDAGTDRRHGRLASTRAVDTSLIEERELRDGRRIRCRIFDLGAVTGTAIGAAEESFGRGSKGFESRHFEIQARRPDLVSCRVIVRWLWQQKTGLEGRIY